MVVFVFGCGGSAFEVCSDAGLPDRPAVGSCAWARLDDEAKRRRQGLVVCRAALPFEGLFDACPGVTLAPTFAAWAACQSRTVRW